MYNSNGVRDCRELLEMTVVSKDRFPKLKNFSRKYIQRLETYTPCNLVKPNNQTKFAGHDEGCKSVLNQSRF